MTQQQFGAAFDMAKTASELVGSLAENSLRALQKAENTRRQQVESVGLKAIEDFKKIKADPSLLDLLIVTDQGWEFRPAPPIPTITIPEAKNAGNNGTKAKETAKAGS